MIENLLKIKDEILKIEFDRGWIRIWIKSPFSFGQDRYIFEKIENFERCLDNAVRLRDKMYKHKLNK